jgi:hypothetical protein
MGVLGLHGWVEQRGLGRPVVLKPGDEASWVVLDGACGMLEFFGHWSLLGDFSALRDNVARFVAKLAAVNVRLVVVLDGAVPPAKFATWLSRRRKEVRDVAKLNTYMHGGDAGAKRSFVWLPPAFSQTMLGQAFRAAGCPVVYSSVEADKVVARVAAQLNARGVMGHDSDFLVLPLRDDARYLDFHTLKFNKGSGAATVLAYDQREVLAALGLPQQAMPLLAASLGFDLHKRPGALVRASAAARDANASSEAAAPVPHVVDLALAGIRARVETPGALAPRNQREADAADWYELAPPVRLGIDGAEDDSSDQAPHAVVRPHVEVLLRDRAFVGPLCIEDVSSPGAAGGISVFAATLALRAAVYARLLGATTDGDPRANVITELLCSARCDPEWPLSECDFTNAAAAAHPADVLALAPPAEAPAVALARHVVSTWLSPHLSSRQATALVQQADPQRRRDAAEAAAAAAAGKSPQHSAFTLRKVRPADAHAASLFLVAMDCFAWGAPPHADLPVWEVFHGPTFHALCRPPPPPKKAATRQIKRSYSSATKKAGAPPHKPAAKQAPKAAAAASVTASMVTATAARRRSSVFGGGPVRRQSRGVRVITLKPRTSYTRLCAP